MQYTFYQTTLSTAGMEDVNVHKSQHVWAIKNENGDHRNNVTKIQNPENLRQYFKGIFKMIRKLIDSPFSENGYCTIWC